MKKLFLLFPGFVATQRMMGTHNLWTRHFSPQESLLKKYFRLCTHYIHAATLGGEPYCFITVQSSTTALRYSV